MTSSTDPIVRFENVQKSYDGETLVVKNLNLDIAPGEFVTMLGPSGSGKTTCLMMLAGFESVTAGNIFLKDKILNNVPPHRRNIGMVFQNYALFPHMTVAENLAFPLEVRKLDRATIDKKVQHALDMVQLGEFGNRRPLQLSGGQQQRVAVARALVFDADLILMDEPLGALDKNLREDMQYEIKHIHEQLGVTVVYVTHDQSEALTMSNRIAVFNDGVIQQLSSPADLYERPTSAFVARFIGENNRLIGTVRQLDKETASIQLPNGDLIKAVPISVSGKNENSTVSLRPERVFLNDLAEDKVNKFQGQVRELIYLGDHIRARISVCGSDEFIVKVPNSSDIAGVSEGQDVTVGWSPEDCRALDAT